MACTKFYLDCRRVSDNRPSPLKLVISHKHKTAYISLNISLLPHEWDSKKEKIKNRSDKHSLNIIIYEMKRKVDEQLLILSREQKISFMPVSDIKRYVLCQLDPENQPRLESKDSFLYRFKKYADRMNNGSKKTYYHTLNRLFAFKGEEVISTLRFEDITVGWLMEFDQFLSHTSSSRNTRNIHYRNIRTVFNDAIEDGITSFYPFRRFKIKGEATPKRNLSVGELRQLAFFDCEECAVKYRDYFLLMFFLMGINNIDLCHLKEITKGRIEFHRSKTNHFFSMKVEPEAMAIIEKYRGEEWLLDILDHWSSDEFFRRKMNKCLQKIGPVSRNGLGGKKAYSPMFPKLTTYYARHSWATIASSIDIPMETISAGLGHQYGNRITAIYIEFDYRKVEIANRKIIDWVLYGKIDGKVVVQPGTPEFFGLDEDEAVALGLVKKTAPEKLKRGCPRKTAQSTIG